MNDVDTKFPDPKTGDMRPAVWRDKHGVLHSAVGSWFNFPFNPFLVLWTACGRKDVPANGAWLQISEDQVDCADCIGAAG